MGELLLEVNPIRDIEGNRLYDAGQEGEFSMHDEATAARFRKRVYDMVTNFLTEACYRCKGIYKVDRSDNQKANISGFN